MPSQYTIVQYLPNPISGERINIGAIAFDSQTTLVYFLKSWDRVKAFAGQDRDIGFLHYFVERITRETEEGKLKPHNIIQMTKNINSIQLTEPYWSLESVEVLLSEIVRDFLVE